MPGSAASTPISSGSILEVYGIPSVFLVGPPNTPESKQAEYQTIAEALIADGRG